MYTDGSVVRDVKSGWDFVAKVKGKFVANENSAYETTKFSMRMEVEVVSRAFF
jgi:hypothetical protein